MAKLPPSPFVSSCDGCENLKFAYESIEGGARYRCAHCALSIYLSPEDLAHPAETRIDVGAFMNDVEAPPAFILAPRPEYLKATEILPIVEVLGEYLGETRAA